MVRDSGPQNSQKSIDIFRQVSDMEVPEFTLESLMQLKEIPCKWPEEKRKKTFFDCSVLYGEHFLDICQQPDSESCMKADIATAQFASALAKYKATGVCPNSNAVPIGMDKMGSSPFG
ncbi:unnamed protein product [Larinioides sclopetarius]|uniref:Uncharacterized protein n=1 Tax=Larinioides sclopetarius TaxID=280406 RepID=A0AAV2B2G2_9ARAC